MTRFFRNLRNLPARFETAVDAADVDSWIRGLDLAFAGIGFCVIGLVGLLVALGLHDAVIRH